MINRVHCLSRKQEKALRRRVRRADRQRAARQISRELESR